MVILKITHQHINSSDICIVIVLSITTRWLSVILVTVLGHQRLIALITNYNNIRPNKTKHLCSLSLGCDRMVPGFIVDQLLIMGRILNS